MRYFFKKKLRTIDLKDVKKNKKNTNFGLFSTLILSLVLKQPLTIFQGLLALSKVLKQETKALCTTCMPLEETTFVVHQGGLVTSGHLLNAERYLQFSSRFLLLLYQLFWQVTTHHLEV